MTEQAAGPGRDGLAGLDLARLDDLRDLEPGDTGYLDRAIDNFETNSLATVETVRAAVAAGDLETAARAAHKIAGSALNLGSPRAGEVAQATELAARDGSLDEAVLARFDEALAEARRQLRRYQATYRGGR